MRTKCLMSFSVPARRGACAIIFCTLDVINVAAAATDATCAAFVSNRRRVNTGALDIDELLTFPVLRFSRRDRRRQDCTCRRRPADSPKTLFRCRRPGAQCRPFDPELLEIRHVTLRLVIMLGQFGLVPRQDRKRVV